MVEIFDFPYQRLEKTFSEYRIANLGGFCNYNILLLLASSFVEHALFLLFFYEFIMLFASFLILLRCQQKTAGRYSVQRPLTNAQISFSSSADFTALLSGPVLLCLAV